MESTPRLYDTLVNVLGPHQNWLQSSAPENPGLDDGGPHAGWHHQPHGVGPLCAEPSDVRAEYRAAVCPLARE